ncbi:MauE/DoxX family redox-associated membrane protein [Nonlabens ponticola]|uniref:Methylamine utilisation protein MauE domain-containing protein n=1 Tax=Nonlabens ponticola TaxID=2496866 RepID=A0A3S9MY23_9FLAO|nr:MauE/DoxX family redox-associated membrane protein [Nonlabens ponticola]AZQ44032.1 hypothetical protein EJ995_07225 [Nonlabens ponticola]
MRNFYLRTDIKTIIYGITRVGLGIYLLSHAAMAFMDFDQFMATALSYFPEDSGLSFLAYLTPIVPFMEFFLAVMILAGIYTKLALKWAIGIGIFFTVFFHYTGDLDGALTHSYSLLVKIFLLFTIFYNKFSLDYYNMWKVSQESSESHSHLL